MIRAGAATRVINNELGTTIQGASVDNVAQRQRDDLEANALYLARGETSVLLVSCDLVGLARPWIDETRASMAAAAGLPTDAVWVGCTHTHSGPSLLPTNYLKGIDEAYRGRLRDWLTALAAAAVEAAVPARLGWGQGAARLGYCRRLCFADGSHSLGGDPTREDYTGLEGPSDPAQTVIGVQDTEGRCLAVLHQNTAHPVAFYGGEVYSADYPGAARGFLREVLGPVPVLYFNGAFGDQNGRSPTAGPGGREDRERLLARGAHLLAGETLRLLHEMTFHDDLPLARRAGAAAVRRRRPEAERVAWARETLRRVDEGESVTPYDRMFAYGTHLLDERLQDGEEESLPLHALRLGELLLLSEPCELFCRFGLDLKRRSPAPATAILGQTNGAEGYVPTLEAAISGGYSGEPLDWARLDRHAGYRIVEAGAALLHRLWRESAPA